jgi:hypothetical protein
LSCADEREVEHHGLGLHVVAGLDRVGGLTEVGGVQVHKDEVEAPPSELQGHGPAEAGSRASDDGPLTVAAVEILRLAQAEQEEREEARANGGDVQRAKAGQHDEPDWSSHRSSFCFLVLLVVAREGNIYIARGLGCPHQTPLSSPVRHI